LKKNTSLSKNHSLHFILTLVVIILFSLGVFWYLHSIEIETQNTNRLSGGRLIINSLESYQKELGEYPQSLSELEDFIYPLPRDPKTGELFEYKKEENSLTLIIPQDGLEDIVIRR
jgi:hypothetical protein